MVIGVGRTLWLLRRILGQPFHDDLDGLVQLGINPLPHERGVKLHFYVRNDPDILRDPMAVRAPDSGTRRRYITSIHKLGSSGPADEASPGALAHQGSHFSFLKVPGHGVPARPGELVDEHDLGPEDSTLGLDFVLSVAGGDEAYHLSLEAFDDIRGQHASAVNTLIHDKSLT